VLKGQITIRLAHPEAEVGRCIEETDRIDRQETSTARAERAAHLTRRYHRIRKEIKRLLAIDKTLADAPDEQISSARAMATRAQHSATMSRASWMPRLI
jgi:hypothetical protein